MWTTKLVGWALLAGASTFALLGSPERADACGAFFARKTSAATSRPSLSLERVLIVFDPAKKEEHFVREIVFDGGSETFGFVVPTPSRPTVAEVKKPPFDELERRYPFARLGGSEKARAPGGAPGGGGAPKVIVHEVKYLGSFSAFVIEASDANALAGWLAQNGFGTTPESEAWLGEYVRRGFHHVAFRYEPTLDPKRGQSGLRAQTVRITFSTPLPFYPYREPEHAAASPRRERAVSLWLASPEPMVPIALASAGAGPAWVRPFREGLRDDRGDRESMKAILGEELGKQLPSAPVVQTFQDQKASRSGYGDVVFLPAAGLAAASTEATSAFVRSTLLPLARTP